MLKGVIYTYNTQGVLLPTQRRSELPCNNTHFEIIDTEGKVLDVAVINRIYWRREENTPSIEVEYVPFMAFDARPNSFCWTYNQTEENRFDIYVKPLMVGKPMTIHWCAPVKCELNTEYTMPPEYEELFTLSLCVLLLNAFPRENDAMKSGFESQLAATRNAIVAKQAENKLIMNNRYLQDPYTRGISGQFLFGR